MPDPNITAQRVKLLLKQNNLSTDEVPIALLKQAIFKISTTNEIRGNGLEKKMKMMGQFGLIREVRNGVWSIR